jgi:hypothetical protein
LHERAAVEAPVERTAASEPHTADDRTTVGSCNEAE